MKEEAMGDITDGTITSNVYYCETCGHPLQFIQEEHQREELCPKCGFHIKAGLEDDIASADFLKDVNIEENPIYYAHVEYIKVPDKKAKEKVVEHNIRKLYGMAKGMELDTEKIYSKFRAEKEHKNDTIERILHELELPVQIVIKNNLPSTEDEALKMIDSIIENRFITEKIIFERELDFDEIDDMKKIFDGENVNAKNSFLMYVNKKIRMFEYLVGDEESGTTGWQKFDFK